MVNWHTCRGRGNWWELGVTRGLYRPPGSGQAAAAAGRLSGEPGAGDGRQIASHIRRVEVGWLENGAPTNTRGRHAVLSEAVWQGCKTENWHEFFDSFVQVSLWLLFIRLTPITPNLKRCGSSQEPPGQDRGYKVVDEVNKIKPTSWFERAPEGLVGSWTLDSF